ncbi:hypothetical protein KY386_02400 [Candidatus Parcubacteria bacterium]|nr:hypothetical protein [Candidatus Parcubacteria bacterium]
MLQSVATPITYILKLLAGSIYIGNGLPLSSDVPVVACSKYYRDRSPIEGVTVSEALPALIGRVKASSCCNPRDGADQNGCKMDHSFEVPDDVPYAAFDPYLWEIAELLWLAGPSKGVPAIGYGQGATFWLEVGHHTGNRYDVRLDVKGGLARFEPTPLYGNPDAIRASAKTPEEALDACIAVLRTKVQKQLSLERLVTQVKERHAGALLHETHPYFVIRQDNTFGMMWSKDGKWYCATGDDRHQAAINGLADRLTCAHDGGRGCTLEPGHEGNHLPPQNIRYQASAN